MHEQNMDVNIHACKDASRSACKAGVKIVEAEQKIKPPHKYQQSSLMCTCVQIHRHNDLKIRASQGWKGSKKYT